MPILNQMQCLPEKGFFPIIKTFGKGIMINCCNVSCGSRFNFCNFYNFYKSSEAELSVCFWQHLTLIDYIKISSKIIPYLQV